MPEADYSVDDQDNTVARGIDLKRKGTNQKPAVAEWTLSLESLVIPEIEGDFLEGCKVCDVGCGLDGGCGYKVSAFWKCT